MQVPKQKWLTLVYLFSYCKLLSHRLASGLAHQTNCKWQMLSRS